MSSISAPSILSFSRLSRIVTDIKARADITRTEATTGRREDITAATNGDVGGAHLLKKAVDDVKAYKSLLTLGQNRAQRTQSVLGGIVGGSVRLGTEALSALGRGDQQALDAIAIDARSTIHGIFGTLNTVEAGRALFGGDVTDRPPLASADLLLADIEAIMAGAVDAADAQAQIDFYFNDPAGGFATSIYLGGANKAPPVEIAPGVRIDVSATAADQPIKDMISGLAALATHGSATFADASVVIDAGAKSALSADTSITIMRSAIGVGEARISDAMSRYDAEEAVLTGLFNDRTARDQFEAASELKLLESQLEASYLLTSRLARLSLANFIR